ncbi:MAG TPA: FecR domain-containing protein [Chitinophagaceae bacterium]
MEANPPAIMEERLRYLFMRYTENSCSKKELQEFFSYIHRSEHELQLRQLIRKVYNELKEDAPVSTFVDENGRLVLTEPQHLSMPLAENKRKRRLILFSRLLAAASIVVAVTIWIIKETRSSENQQASVSSLTKKATDRSESKFLLLEDSTKVWLNAASSLEFPDQFGKNKREVFLSGEAFFDVKHVDKIPFIIHTGNVSTTVLGTAFNIKAYPGQKNITVSVSRGKVIVAREDGWETTLIKGQQVRVGKNKNELTEKNIPVAEVAAWQQGDIVFDDELLADIVIDMQRIYNAGIQLNDPLLQGLKISTSFRKEIGVEQALQVLCKLTDSELKLVNGVYLIQ